MTGPGSPPPDNLPPVTPDGDRVALLHDITRWREQLARSIARNNLEIRSEGITMVTNRIILSLLFLRIAQDRGLIAEDILQGLREHADPYGQLLEVTAPLSVLWEEPAGRSRHDTVPVGSVVIEDRVIHSILSRIVSPDRPYRFDARDVETVADVLAQYLARTIRRSAAHHADVVDTHDTVLSYGSVTPPLPIIRYLAESSVHAAVAGRSKREVLPLRLVDPACGTGTVLLCAYRSLLEETQGCGNLTFEERHAVLTGSLYGLDISPHATAVTKALLFFLLCESCCNDTTAEEFIIRAEGVFRDLRHTIRCGNALISPDIVDDESWPFCPPREQHALIPFAWNAEFPEIFAAGGFDAVIMHPPEGLPEQKEWVQRYLQRHYEVYDPAADRSSFFTEKSLSLLRTGGTLAFCTGDQWLRAKPATPLRALLAGQQVEEIVIIPARPGAALVRISRQAPSHPVRVALAGFERCGDLRQYVRTHAFPVDPALLGEGGWTLRDTRADAILERVSRHSTPLEDVVMGQVQAGISIAEGDPFVINGTIAREWFRRDPRCKSLVRPIVSAKESGPQDQFLILIPGGWTRAHPQAEKRPWQWFRHRHPLIARHLHAFAEVLKSRAGQDTLWWETTCDEFWHQPQKKLLFPEKFSRLVFRFDNGRGIGDATMLALPSSGLYLAGVLNSRLMGFIFDQSVRQTAPEKNIFPWNDLCQLPVYTPDLDRPDDRARYNRVEQFVRRKIDLEKNFRNVTTDPEREVLQKKIQSTDAKINVLVYELYGLTPEEIAVVETSSA